MAYFTPNLNLKKPAQTDFYDVDDFNGNMDILDAAYEMVDCGNWENMNLQQAIAAHNANPLAHSVMSVDGGEDVSGAIETHNADMNAHQNMETDGNGGEL
jgi:hypothetical protein